MERRRVLVGAGCLLVSSISGCVAVDPAEDDSDDEPPEPVVEDVRVPAVERVDDNGDVDTDAGGGMPTVESIDDADSDLEFAATFENAGDTGEAAISLYLLEATGDDESVLSAGAPARVSLMTFEVDERREVSFDDVSPNGYDAYYFTVHVGSVEADVHNEGEDGLVEVELTSPNGETTDERISLELAAGATETVSFDGPFSREEYDVWVGAVDESRRR
ncbi:hypothetical protein OB955_13540 [Halobacteria archaeon AArc-m2/3/4]|uniref:Uncharacterized protein n=1 Tax=Natronoglomus mannanivorans TaxID=2979990 RepID=A0AAP2YWQ3_9EURY|nr:hypothetical protein [Halobacteria archaeon AArc-xg1-1]MCU4973758.1 hypothetical protein [Halobacteria archaeon AArc-m2/3/4]